MAPWKSLNLGLSFRKIHYPAPQYTFYPVFTIPNQACKQTIDRDFTQPQLHGYGHQAKQDVEDTNR